MHQNTTNSLIKKLLTKRAYQKHNYPRVCTEKCHIHTDEVIKFFCLQHEELACHDCVALNHRSCDLDYIPDKCADIGDSEEFRKTVWLLGMKMAEVNYVKQKATKRGKEIDTYHEDLIKSIDAFQKKINDRIQEIRKEIQTEIDKKNYLNKQTVQGVLDSCTSMSTDISKLQSKLQGSKTAKQNGKVYIAIKQALAKLRANEIQKSEQELDKTILQNRFEPNQDLLALLYEQDGFGKLFTTLVIPQQKQVKLTKKAVINIRTESDKSQCRITGCAVLSSNELILVDCYNKKLKILNTQRNLVAVEKAFDASPRDVTTLPQDKIAVTFPYRKRILIITTNNKLSTVHTIPVEGECNGIVFHQEYIYVVCTNPNTVVILDTKGTVYNSFSVDVFHKTPYLVVSEDSRLTYVSSNINGIICSITLQGEISAVNKNLTRPNGMIILDDGSLLVCCLDGTIHHISADLKEDQKILSVCQRPLSICYSHQQHEVYIHCKNDTLEVLSLR